jgi:hypothetical protein
LQRLPFVAKGRIDEDREFRIEFRQELNDSRPVLMLNSEHVPQSFALCARLNLPDLQRLLRATTIWQLRERVLVASRARFLFRRRIHLRVQRIRFGDISASLRNRLVGFRASRTCFSLDRCSELEP